MGNGWETHGKTMGNPVDFPCVFLKDTSPSLVRGGTPLRVSQSEARLFFVKIYGVQNFTMASQVVHKKSLGKARHGTTVAYVIWLYSVVCTFKILNHWSTENTNSLETSSRRCYDSSWSCRADHERFLTKKQLLPKQQDPRILPKHVDHYRSNSE